MSHPLGVSKPARPGMAAVGSNSFPYRRGAGGGAWVVQSTSGARVVEPRSAREIRDDVAAGRVSAIEVCRATLERIERTDPGIRAFRTLAADRALPIILDDPFLHFDRERLARVEGLLADIQTSLEALHAQKALMDQAVEQAGSLEFHTKQAEALIAALRQERDVTDKVRAAVAQLRQEGPKAKSA